jgi:hypothetical protein
LYCYLWCFFEKFIYLSAYLWENIHEYKYDNTDKHYIECCDDDIGSRVFLSENMRCIFFATDSPVMYLMREIDAKFEEYISKEECDKKQYEKIPQEISYEK